MEEAAMPRRMLWVLAAIAAAGALTSHPGGAQAPRTVTVGLYADAISLDPEDTNDNLSLSVEREVYDGLLGFTPDMKLKPELATSWDASPDAKVFTFHLRRNVKFQDGTPFNAQAVKLNFDRARDAVHKLKKYSLYEEIASVDALDDATVRFTLKNPFGAMLYNFAHPSSRIISPAALKQGEDQIARHPVGTGPFKFVSWAAGREIVLERNPDYWETGKPAVDRIVFRLVPEDASRVAMLLSGEAQFVFPVPGVQIEAVAKAPGVSVEKRWSIYAYYVAMNTQHVPFNSRQVRQGMNYGVDKEALIKVVLRGTGRPLDAPITPGVAGYSPVQRGGWPYDVAKARQLLAEGGFPRGFTTVLWLGNQTETLRVGEALQQMLSKIGVTVQLQPMEAGTLTAVRYKPFSENQSQLNFTGWSPSTGDADWGLRPHFDSQSWPPTLYNIAFYKNPSVDQLLHDALATADQTRRSKDYAQAMHLIWDDAPWVFLYNSQILAGVRNNVADVFALPDGTVDVRAARLTGK
jgi:glutathione transport system substrate-binding protein